MSAKLPFHASGNTVAVVASTSGSTNYAIGVDGSSPQVMVTNSSTVPGFLSFGSSTVAASLPTTAADAAGYAIPPSGSVVITPGKATYAAGVYASGSATMFLTPGTGGS
jgi:hypothetical protein